MDAYWATAKRQLELGRSTLSLGHSHQAEQLFLEARAAIAANEGTDSARWGIATLDLAICAMHQDEYDLAARRGLNALRVLEAAGSPASNLPTTRAALVVGDAFDGLKDSSSAIAYFELASKAASGVSGHVQDASYADSRLASVYGEVGRGEDAAEAALRAWSTVGDSESCLAGIEIDATKRTIRILEKAGRFLDARALWEWLFEQGFDDADWHTLMQFVGKMGEAGYVTEACDFFNRVERFYTHGVWDVES